MFFFSLIFILNIYVKYQFSLNFCLMFSEVFHIEFLHLLMRWFFGKMMIDQGIR